MSHWRACWMKDRVDFVQNWLDNPESITKAELLVNEQLAYKYYQDNFPPPNRAAICAALAACSEAAEFTSIADLRKKHYKSTQCKKRIQRNINNYRKLIA